MITSSPLIQSLLASRDDVCHHNPEEVNNLRAKEQECLHLLKRCNNMEEFKQVHAKFIKLSLFSSSASSVLSTCARSGWENSMSYAASIFRGIDDPRTFDYNTMIRGYVNETCFEEALCVYSEMMVAEERVEPDNFTYPFLLKACARLKSVSEGKQIHGQVLKLGFGGDVFVQNGLISMYGRCGEMSLSSAVFERMESKTAASWSSMVSARAGAGMWSDCLMLFRGMCRETTGLKAEESGMVSALTACANTGALGLGMSIHGYLLRNINELNNVAVGTSLVDMYAKCGRLDKALRVFKKMESRNGLSYSAMISGLALHGEGEAALRMFSEMREEGVECDGVVYVSVLNACSHSGLVEEGRRVFEEMLREGKVEPSAEHYGCLVDLLGRAGLLEEALEIIQKSMPNDVVWRSFLSSCRVHQNVELGKIAARELIKLSSHNPGDYLVISNMYAQAQMWEDVARVRTEMANKCGLKQTPGFSIVEVKGKTHRFVSQDRFHPQCKEMYKMLHQMEWQLKFEGYSPDLTQVLLNVDDEEEKRERLKGHSQKVALAFALLYTPPGSIIRIARNLRMCSDCHTYTKKISMIYEREIVVRDRNRFHLFKAGTCSCKDYW
ncbi:Pentatricopeptide repeat-containing protein [Raphanus sativus]|uniref:Pentatricopeptide repeat-containing protein At1g31920 n=1 Tax=Raphanus sativus TaxID=3726 RepID=A0A6J0JBG1_RAPSA|nr:pentatricopeptide repeat-containing protein At1g31920 [Raphanus sativus]KAJ4894940.1 Pentatricopeptide repeat-containing protein [Raphanus sativus]